MLHIEHLAEGVTLGDIVLDKYNIAFIGIEIEPKYFDIACRRIEEALKQPDFFVEKPKPVEQAKLAI